MNDTIDVKKIMEDIKSEIAARGLVNDIPAMEDILALGTTSSWQAASLDILKHELNYLKQNEVHYYREITSYHRIFTPIVKFVKRVIRKLCKFLGEPAVNEINEYHRHIVRALEQTVKVLEQHDSTGLSKNAILEERKYKQLAEQNATSNFLMKQEMQELQQTIQQLEEQLIQLKLQSERAELKSDIAKLTLEKLLNEKCGDC